MLADLEQLITLQHIEDDAAAAGARIEEIPATVEALGARLEASTGELALAQQNLDDSRTDRRQLEKKLAAVQTRLDRFREQLMQVKTNREYQAMQVEIGSAEGEIRRLEDEILERMIEGDDLTAEVESASGRLAAEKNSVEAERAALELERDALESRLGHMVDERAKHVGTLAPHLLSLFETVADRRNGTVVARARDGRCSACQVRLRPQLFNDVRTNTRLIRCESCQRVLYYEQEAAAAEGGTAE